MTASILDGLSMVDSTGRLILAATGGTLVLAVVANLQVAARYRSIQADLEENAPPRGRFATPVLADVVAAFEAAAKRTAEPNTQAIVEDRFQAGLGSTLFAERFVRSATGLVIILGLLGTFYGLTSSIGRLIELLAGDPGSTAAITQNVTQGLTQALTGMAVAFSNSLVGVLSAVILTLVGVVSNPTDRRVALMLSVETYLDGLLADSSVEHRSGGPDAAAARFGESVERLDAVVARFDSALQAFSTSTREFSEFNAHLKDNVQRMSLSFGDLNDALRQQVATIKRENGR